jgi:hypothetical protein
VAISACSSSASGANPAREIPANIPLTKPMATVEGLPADLLGRMDLTAILADYA